jgi:hypothetical protein
MLVFWQLTPMPFAALQLAATLSSSKPRNPFPADFT